MRVRVHKDRLVDSLLTVCNLNNACKHELADHINKVVNLPVKFGPGSIKIVHQGICPRTGWDTYAIFLDGIGLFGYCDEAPK